MDKCNKCLHKNKKCFGCVYCFYIPSGVPNGSPNGNIPLTPSDAQKRIRIGLNLLTGNIKMLNEDDLRLLSIAVRRENARRRKEQHKKLCNPKSEIAIKMHEN